MISLATYGYLAVTEPTLHFNWWYALAALLADMAISGGSLLEVTTK